VNQANLFTDFAFSWNGIVYDETTANTGKLTFDPPQPSTRLQ